MYPGLRRGRAPLRVAQRCGLCVRLGTSKANYTHTKEESRRHQMNGVFLFLPFKRQTDGLTELEARCTFVILKWYCMLKRRLSDNLVEGNHRSKISKKIKFILVKVCKF